MSTVLRLSNLNNEIKTHVSVFVPRCLTSIYSRTEYDDNVLNNLTPNFRNYLYSISKEQMANESKLSKESYLDSQKTLLICYYIFKKRAVVYIYLDLVVSL